MFVQRLNAEGVPEWVAVDGQGTPFPSRIGFSSGNLKTLRMSVSKLGIFGMLVFILCS
jgi:hypothetical protein